MRFVSKPWNGFCISEHVLQKHGIHDSCSCNFASSRVFKLNMFNQNHCTFAAGIDLMQRRLQDISSIPRTIHEFYEMDIILCLICWRLMETSLLYSHSNLWLHLVWLVFSSQTRGFWPSLYGSAWDGWPFGSCHCCGQLSRLDGARNGLGGEI